MRNGCVQLVLRGLRRCLQTHAMAAFQSLASGRTSTQRRRRQSMQSGLIALLACAVCFSFSLAILLLALSFRSELLLHVSLPAMSLRSVNPDVSDQTSPSLCPSSVRQSAATIASLHAHASNSQSLRCWRSLSTRTMESRPMVKAYRCICMLFAF